jgi:hypothetical protein
MAHWAKIDDTNLVVDVVVTSNEEPDEGYQWLLDNLGGRWIKTSYNTLAGDHLTGGAPLRMNYAGVGFTYDEVRDAFIPPKPDDIDGINFILDETTCRWVPEQVVSE